MIEVVGHSGGSEFKAALEFKDALESLWPNLARAPKNLDHVIISANVRISGYKVSDIDLVIAGKLTNDYSIRSSRVIKDKSGRDHFNAKFLVKNFVVVVEVKDQPNRSVQIVGDDIQVYYSSGAKTGWSSATNQNVNQLHSLKSFLYDKKIKDVFVDRCVLMRGLSELDCPGAVHGGFTGKEFFSSLAALSKVDREGSKLSLNACATEDINKVLCTSIFQTVMPTNLDRRRMDLIIGGSKEVDEIVETIGKKTVILRGQGGSGKTIMLLQAAHELYRRNGMRTLLLTYNHALAADIRRLLGLLGIASDPYEGGIQVRTVMSFMHTCFRHFGLLDANDIVKYEIYLEQCKNSIALINGGALAKAEILEIIAEHPDSLGFNNIMVDEAQDWPEDEVGLLKAFFGSENLCVADGMNQLIRGGKRTSWIDVNNSENQNIIYLQDCLRMKRNLCDFVSSVSNVGDIEWTLKPNAKAGGGRVIVLKESYASYPTMHAELIKNAKEDGNAEIDFLICVPHSTVKSGRDGKSSKLIELFISEGFKCWNGLNNEVRKDFPKSKDQLRVVQYQSCRGLEGWVVVLEYLDEFWIQRYKERLREGLTPSEEKNFADIEEVATRYAWAQIIMAMSRPIDTLVITLKDSNSKLGLAIKNISSSRSDYIKVM
ncbi:DEAD/DEAH box helicase family protein [Porticoccaceae bacterium]|nr:DEAD/DEAH box helicase family protein [Porticoccaceae bacterium]|tara:strand:+ start:5191 stop:7161 length:1971 start_codon:yes stop_codon:yes gene_type:complete